MFRLTLLFLLSSNDVVQVQLTQSFETYQECVAYLDESTRKDIVKFKFKHRLIGYVGECRAITEA